VPTQHFSGGRLVALEELTPMRIASDCIIGTILALTFVAKLMDIGNPKNKKGIVQEILGVVMWGYIGKSFFDFIGVTKPIDLAGIVSKVRRP
jgi:hypothetical protein